MIDQLLDHRVDIVGVIAVGGVIGATARYALAQAIPAPDRGFPLATLLTNVIGSFLLGLIVVVSVELLPPKRYFRPFFAIGLLGSFTTFSTFAFETVTLVENGQILRALAYISAMLLSGIVAARIGIGVARRLPTAFGRGLER